MELHALLVTSGRMGHARSYLHLSLSPSVHCWSAEEDHVIGGADAQKSRSLAKQIGADKVKARAHFLAAL